MGGIIAIIANRAIGTRQERRLGPDLARLLGITTSGRRGDYSNIVMVGAWFIFCGCLLVLSRLL